MANKLREIFSNELTEAQKKFLKRINAEAVRKKACTECEYYYYERSMPGFVTYYGDCDKGHTVMPVDTRGPCLDYKRRMQRRKEGEQ